MHHSHKHIAHIHKKQNKKPQHLVVLAASVLYPLTTLPQVYLIYTNHSAEDVSLSMYVMYVLFAFVFLYYGISEKLRPVIVLQLLWIVMYVPVLVGILLYG